MFSFVTFGLSPIPLENFQVPNQATASNLPFCDIFVPQKVLLLKISDDVIACDFWFGPSPIKNPGYAYGTRIYDVIVGSRLLRACFVPISKN